MFFDNATRTAFGSLGWVDKGALWCWHAETATERRVAIGDSRYVSVKDHGGGLLLLGHHGAESGASLRSCEKPDIEIASLRPAGDGWRFAGESRLWGDNLALLMTTGSGQQAIALVNGPAETVRVLDTSWFNETTYDLGYQGLVDCLAFPENGVVVVSVQRSSELVLIDIGENLWTGTIPLAGRGGNPDLTPLGGSLFMASDYDSLCLVDVRIGLLKASDVLQPAAAPNTAQFIGRYAVGASTGVVARPYSGDVLRFDMSSLAFVDRASVPGQPLEVCMTSERTFVTRDWKSGQVETGVFGE